MAKLSVTTVSLEPVISDFLKWEATPLTRIRVSAPSGTKIGELVDYPYRSMKLVALSNESDGTVLVQPHNCIVDLKMVNAEKDVLLKMAGDGDLYGISYLGRPDGIVPEKKLPPASEATKPAAENTVQATPPVALKRTLVFFGDSTSAHIGGTAATVAAGQDFAVINNAQGGSLASYALMSMDGSPSFLTFAAADFPAKGSNVSVSATLSFGEGVTPFSMHSTVVLIEQPDGSTIEAAITGQTTAVKVIPREGKSYVLDTDRKYPIKLKASGSTDGVCVIGTAKNDINGANIGNWQAVLDRIKTYVQKCVEQVEPQSNKRFILLTNWGDSNGTGYDREVASYRVELKEAYNNWLKTTWPNQVVDIEAYILSDKVWTDTAISPTEEDLQLQRSGRLAKSLSSDNGAHLLPVVRTKIAEMVIAKAKELQYL